MFSELIKLCTASVCGHGKPYIAGPNISKDVVMLEIWDIVFVPIMEKIV